MPETPAAHALIAHRTDEAPSAFECTWTDGGLDSARAQVAVLDLRELTFMDSSGVHAILDADVRARLLKRRLVVVRGCPQVDRMFALTGASRLLEVGDLDSAEPPVQSFLPPAVKWRST